MMERGATREGSCARGYSHEGLLMYGVIDIASDVVGVIRLYKHGSDYLPLTMDPLHTTDKYTIPA